MTTYPTFKKRLFATDLDHTIVEQHVPHDRLCDMLLHTSLIYITGRHYESAMQLIETEKLPLPDVLICDVGASIYVGPQFTLDEAWAAQIDEQALTRVAELAAQLAIERQPIATRWRRSYFASPLQYEALQMSVAQHNVEATLIYSSARDLDVLPQQVDKGRALEYVLTKTAYNGEIVVAGDSENDVSLFELGVPAIAVSNACDAILQLQYAHIHYATKPAAAGVQEVLERLYR